MWEIAGSMWSQEKTFAVYSTLPSRMGSSRSMLLLVEASELFDVEPAAMPEARCRDESAGMSTCMSKLHAEAFWYTSSMHMHTCCVHVILFNLLWPNFRSSHILCIIIPLNKTCIMYESQGPHPTVAVEVLQPAFQKQWCAQAIRNLGWRWRCRLDLDIEALFDLILFFW